MWGWGRRWRMEDGGWQRADGAGAEAEISPLHNPAQTKHIQAMTEITLQVTACGETGGYVARWDDPGGGGITTQGDPLEELNLMVTDAVKGYFEPGQHPRRVRLHFAEDPALLLA